MRSVCIIDDEFRARERVRKLIEEEPGFNVVGEADNGRAAVEIIDTVKPDLIILDIKMPGLSGFQILQEAEHTPAVIFVTAYNEHAVQAFDIHAVDYLLKPFTDKRFKDALFRLPFGEKIESKTLIELRALIEGHSGKKTYKRRIAVKDTFEYRIVEDQDIDFFTIEGGLVFLHTNGVCYVIDQTLSELERELDPGLFFRAHRKSLVNIKKVKAVVPWGRGRYVLRFTDDEKVHLSKEKTTTFKRLIGLG